MKTPEHPHYIRGETVALLKRAAHAYNEQRMSDVWALANKVLTDDPDNAQAMFLLGQAALARDWQGLAYQLFRRATALRPDIGQNWLGFGAAALDMRRWPEAEECMHTAAKLLPTSAMPLSNLATIALNSGRPREAIEWADKANALESGVPHITLNKGFAYLMLKDWERGFEGFRHNLLTKGRTRRVYRQPEEPDWDGTPGQTVVVQCEQGLGDEIAGMSCITDLIQDCKKVVIDTHPKLINLFKRSFPHADCYGTRKQSDLSWPLQYDIDATVQLSTLGYWYRKRDADFPRRPWLVPSPELREKWREWLDQFPGQHCGLAWTGGIFLTNRTGRSATLSDMAEILQPGATYFSLEYRDDLEAVDEWNAAHPLQRVIRPPFEHDDYDDTVAFLAEMDYVISATTTVVHACGAMGRQCACFVPAELTSSQWRYGLEGDEMIWYPRNSVQMYRQHRSEADMRMALHRIAKDWSKVLALRMAA